MKPDLIRFLCCPTCQASLGLAVSEQEAGQVKTGTLTCATGHSFPVQGFVPRFIDSDKYVGSFSRQRQYVKRHFASYVNDQSGYALFSRTTGMTDEMVAEGVTLEVGCGYGRFVDVVQSKGGRIVGVDLSTDSVDLAQSFVGMRPGVDIVQADLFHLPFPRRSFDRVFSIGVLHHTPDTRKAFEAIAEWAKPGGRVSIWVYHPDDKRSADRMRRITTRMNYRALYGFCIANQVSLSWVRALPGGWRINRLIDGAIPVKGRPFWMRVMSDFDNLSPTYAHSHSANEVVAWFVGMGFENVQALGRRTAVTGTARQRAIE